ncbi:MAG: S-layer homology domain-containing protein [Oscillospiraceae bacterium]|nr:S-layer homology domain-containing protein [Oscillospiraceae bacterium]
MKRKIYTLFRAALALCLMFCLTLPVFAGGADPAAGETDESVFAERYVNDAKLVGLFLTEVPDSVRLVLGDRQLRAGDALLREDLLRLRVLRTDPEAEVRLTFLPFYNEGVQPEAVVTFHVQKDEDAAPQARNGELETWRNLPNTGTLRAEDDREGPLTFRIVNQPRRGTVELEADGTFTYTPKRNKVGEDSFTFTAADAAGHESGPATVRIKILTPQDAQTFADLPRNGQFTALWLRDSGLFGGEQVSGQLSFGPEKTVSRADFLTMLMDLLGIAPEPGLPSTGFADEQAAAAWQRPYLASALRRGLIRGSRSGDGLVFRPNDPITEAEAALIVSRVTGGAELPVSTLNRPVQTEEVGDRSDRASRVEALYSSAPLTRQALADLLYAVSRAN